VAAVALIEVLDAEGRIERRHFAARWPVRVGRAFDNDLIVLDPHVAAHHLSIDGTTVSVLRTRNGATLDGEHVPAAHEGHIGPESVVGIGRTRLRITLASAVEGQPERALDTPDTPASEAPEPSPPPRDRRIVRSARRPIWLGLTAGAALFAASLASETWLDTGWSGETVAWFTSLLAGIGALLAWIGVWALASRIFVHRFFLAAHARVAIWGSVAAWLLDHLLSVVAFAFSLDLLARYAFAIDGAVLTVIVYLHLTVMQPDLRRAFQRIAVGLYALGLALTFTFNWMREESLTPRLYMTDFYPPALRIAPAVEIGVFLGETAPLKAELEKRAGELREESK